MDKMSSGAEPANRGIVLLCEDEPIVALDMKLIIEDAGYGVAGPFSRVSAALEQVGTPLVAAILDVRLRDGEVFPVAEELARRGVPLIFHSAHIIEDDIASRYPGSRYCPKPIDDKMIGAALRECALPNA